MRAKALQPGEKYLQMRMPVEFGMLLHSQAVLSGKSLSEYVLERLMEIGRKEGWWK